MTISKVIFVEVKVVNLQRFRRFFSVELYSLGIQFLGNHLFFRFTFCILVLPSLSPLLLVSLSLHLSSLSLSLSCLISCPKSSTLLLLLEKSNLYFDFSDLVFFFLPEFTKKVMCMLENYEMKLIKNI